MSSTSTHTLSQAFRSFAQEGGFRITGDGKVYGASRRYPFEAALITRGQGVVCFFVRVDGVLSTDALTALRGKLDQGWTVGIAARGNYTLTYNAAKNKGGAHDLARALDAMTAALAADKVPVPDVCPICQKKHCDALAKVQDMGFGPVHRACVRNAAKDLRPAAKAGSVPAGWIGAVLGALAGALPSVITTLLLGRIFLLAYALIPLLAFQGYKLLWGKIDHRAPLTATAVTSLAGLFLLQLFFAAWSQGAALSPALYGAVFGPADVLKSLLLWLFGLWMAWGQLSRTSGYAAESFTSTLDTMTTPDGKPLQSGHQKD